MPTPNVQLDPNSFQPLSGAVATPQSTGTNVPQAPQAAQGISNLPDKAPQQGISGPQAQAQSAAPSSDSPHANVQLDPDSFQATNGDGRGGDASNDEGLLSRTAEGTGVPALASLAGQQIESNADNAVQAPIDVYHEAVEAYRAGDWKAATRIASTVINKPLNFGITADSPIFKALTNIIMQPVDNIKESYKQARANGSSPVGAGAEAAIQTLTGTPSSAELASGANRVSEDFSKDDLGGVLGDVAGTSGQAFGSVPLVGGIAHQIGGNLDTDLHAHNYMAAVGDVLGPLLTLGAGKLVGAFGDSGEATTGVPAPPNPNAPSMIDTVKPGGTTVAGIKIPQVSGSPAAQRLSALASKKAAQDFVARNVQTPARAALQSNFAKSALNDVDELRSAQGLPSTGEVPPSSPLFDLDKTGKFMKDEAQVTYKKLDAAAEADIAEWKEQAKAAKEADAQATEQQKATHSNNPNSEASTAPKPITTATDALPPQPLKFTELQDQLRRADRTIKSTNPALNQVDREAAIKNYPKYKQQMDEFIAKHEGEVNEGELDAADKVRAKATRYGYLANKIRVATKGLGAGVKAGETGKDVTINETTLDNIPAQFDNKYGPGSFNRLLGPEGSQNYNSVIKALQEPQTGGRLLDMLNAVPLGAGKAFGSLPANMIVDNLLFNPTFGRTALNAFYRLKAGVATVKNAAKSAGASTVQAAIPAQIAAQPTTQPNNGADAARQALGNPKRGKPLTAPIPSTTPDSNAATSPDAATAGNRAIADLPPEIRNAVTTIPVNVTNGESTKTDAAPQGSVASVTQGAGNNTVKINSPQDFANNPTATMGHELTHVWQNNLPPSVQAKIPDDPKDSSAFDISDVDTLRKQGKTLVDVPREKAATIVQTYVEAKPGSATRKRLQPWVDDLGNTPLSSTQPTAPDATKLNMNPRAPGLPSSSVAGMR